MRRICDGNGENEVKAIKGKIKELELITKLNLYVRYFISVGIHKFINYELKYISMQVQFRIFI